MSGLFEDIAQFDQGIHVARRQAAAVAQKRVSDTVGGYLRLAKNAEEYTARLDFVSDDIKQIVADVSEEYQTDKDTLLKAIDEHLKGDGVTDLDSDLESAPSAVGAGKQAKASESHCPKCNSEMEGDSCSNCDYSDDEGHESHVAGGHKDGCECGFCKNKGSFGKKDKNETDDEASDEEVAKVKGILSDEEKNDKDASEPAWRENLKATAALSAQDFVMLADTIAKAPGASPQLAEHFADQLAQTNPRFDRERFIAAASGNPLTQRDAPAQPQQAPQSPMQQAAPPQGSGGSQPMPAGGPAQQSLASVHEAEADRDGGGATKTEKLPKGDGKSVGTGPSPKIDKKTWRPNALNPSTNTPPVDTEMSGTPNPTEQQDVTDERDYESDFLRNTDAVTDHQDLPSAGPDGFSTERNISQDGQDGSWSDAGTQANPVTASFLPDNTVESAIRSFKEKD